MEQFKELFKSVASYPLLAFMLIIFLVQSYMMMEKLDLINQTLVEIHKDNAQMQQYLEDNTATARINKILEDLQLRLDSGLNATD